MTCSTKSASKAVGQMTRFIQKGELNEFEVQGLVQCFEYTYELSWNVLKDWFETQGETEIHGSKDAFRLAFRRGVVQDGEVWMDMVRKRQLTTHTYSDEIVQSIVQVVVDSFFP